MASGFYRLLNSLRTRLKNISRARPATKEEELRILGPRNSPYQSRLREELIKHGINPDDKKYKK